MSALARLLPAHHVLGASPVPVRTGEAETPIIGMLIEFNHKVNINVLQRETELQFFIRATDLECTRI